MIRRSKTHKGVYQRCRGDCPDPCRKHSWSYSVELPGRDGHRRQVTQAGHASQRAAAQARAEVVGKDRRGALADDRRMTVGQWLDEWLTARRKDVDSPLRQTTAHGYAAHIDGYLKPTLGHHRLRDLTSRHVAAALTQLVEDRERETAAVVERNRRWRQRNPRSQRDPYPVPRPISRATLTRIRATLSSALGDAVDAGLLEHNPAAKARVRKGKRRVDDRPAVKAWGPAEVATFLDAIEAHPLHIAYHLAAYLGLRRGEVLGLAWSAVDFDAGVLHVSRTRVAAGYGIVIDDDPKSAASKAPVALDRHTVAVLKAWKREQAKTRLGLGEAWAAGDLVCTRPDGKPWHPDAVTKMFTRLVTRHGLPKISLHGLRHSSASVAIAAGVPIEVVSKRLRHADVKITSGVYSHLVGTVGAEAAQAAADLIGAHRKTR